MESPAPERVEAEKTFPLTSLLLIQVSEARAGKVSVWEAGESRSCVFLDRVANQQSGGKKDLSWTDVFFSFFATCYIGRLALFYRA